MIQGRLHVEGVPEHNGIGDETKRAKRVFLAFTVSLADLAALAVADGAGLLVAAFTAIKLRQNPTSIAVIIDKIQPIDGSVDPPLLDDGLGEAGGPLTFHKRSDQLGCLHGAKLQGARDAQHVVPMVPDAFRPGAVASEFVEGAIAGVRVDAQETRFAGIGGA